LKTLVLKGSSSCKVAEGKGDFGYNAKLMSMLTCCAVILIPKVTRSIENAAQLLE
jgi:predicted metal-binding protein